MRPPRKFSTTADVLADPRFDEKVNCARTTTIGSCLVLCLEQAICEVVFQAINKTGLSRRDCAAFQASYFWSCQRVMKEEKDDDFANRRAT